MEKAQNQSYRRLQDFGIKIGKYPTGIYNAITDVAGVKVGHVTLISGEGALRPGHGPIRTGVTAILPAAGDLWHEKLMAGSFVLNGNGEATGLMWLQESGILETPIALTNTLSVGEAQKGLLNWMLMQNPEIGITDDTLTALVLECDDSALNDIRGQHVLSSHVHQALELAQSGPVAEGTVGAGTGMMSYEFKGGIGTSSRRLLKELNEYTVAVLVNANHGKRHNLRVKGAPVGEEITDLLPAKYQDGSIVVIIATDAPLDARQLNRLAKWAMLGLARTGGVAYHGSGDVAVAFSTANRIPHYPEKPILNLQVVSDFWLNQIFEATADAAEEAILNALVAATTVVGRDHNTAHGIPHGRLAAVLKKYGAV